MLSPIIWIVAGLIGGLIRTIVTGKGIIALPSVKTVPDGSRHLNLGFVAPMAIGALAGYLTSNSLGVDGAVAAIAGYAGSDLLENVVERTFPKKKK